MRLVEFRQPVRWHCPYPYRCHYGMSTGARQR
jgi:hypothetical protein